MTKDKKELETHRQQQIKKAAAELLHEQMRLTKYLRNHQTKTQDIVSSLSYRLGYTLTYPIRKIVDSLKGKSTPLFHQLKSGEPFLKAYDKNVNQILRLVSGNSQLLPTDSQNSIEGYLDGLSDGVLKGWYRNVHNPFVRLELQVFHKEQIVAKTFCDLYRLDLAQQKIGDGHYGFELNLKDGQKIAEGEITLKLKNGPVLSTYRLQNGVIETIREYELKSTHHSTVGDYKKYDFTFEGLQKDCVCGWIINTAQPEDKVKLILFEEDKFIKSAKANEYRSDVEFVGKGDGKFGFRIKIPYEKLTNQSKLFKVFTEDSVYLGEVAWDANLYKKQLSIHPFKPNKTLYLPIDDGLSKLVLEPLDFKTAVHVHVFYVDVFERICEFLKNIPNSFDLLVSISQDIRSDIDKVINKANLQAKVIIKKVPNRGRDIAPMIVEFGKQLLTYDLALHLHTKKTAHNKNLGELWMLHILKSLLSDQLYLNHIFKLFKYDDKLGLVSPTLIDDLIPFYNWGENHQLATKLFKQIKLNTQILPNEDEAIEFPAGTMFWFRPKALDKLLTSQLNYTSFPKEPIEADGTIAHAIERCVYYIAKQNSYNYLTVEPLKPKPFISKDILISIIIPVYNAKKWLSGAVQSIVTQKAFLANYEIILVDNNSTDGCDGLCKQFAYLYPQIQYYTEVKKGAGNARNLGLKNAKGAYIFFLDADDLIGNTSLQALADKAIHSDAELIVSPLVIFDERQFKEASPYAYTIHQNTLDMRKLKTKKADEVEEKLLYALFSDFGPCAKLYKRSFIEENDLFFPENTNYEDNIFIYNVYLKVNKIEICGSPTYYYRKFQEEKGITQSTSADENSLIEQCVIIKKLQQLAQQKSNKNLGIFVDASFIKKLYWFFNVLDKLPPTNSLFYNYLKEILNKIPNSIIEQEGMQYVSFFKTIRKGDYPKAKSIFSSIK